MVVSLPLPAALKKESGKVIEIKIPDLTSKIRESRLVSAFRVVLFTPIK